MNLFILSPNPIEAAQYHNDSHVRKMIVETAQLLSTAHRVLDGKEYYELSKNNRRLKRFKLNNEREKILYKATHINHPCAIWVRENIGNYYWAFTLLQYLIFEFEYRFEKTHKTESLLHNLIIHPNNIKDGKITPFVQAMPENCKDKNAIKAYRNYYINEKMHLAKWTKRGIPDWIFL